MAENYNLIRKFRQVFAFCCKDRKNAWNSQECVLPWQEDGMAAV